MDSDGWLWMSVACLLADVWEMPQWPFSGKASRQSDHRHFRQQGQGTVKYRRSWVGCLQTDKHGCFMGVPHHISGKTTCVPNWSRPHCVGSGDWSHFLFQWFWFHGFLMAVAFPMSKKTWISRSAGWWNNWSSKRPPESWSPRAMVKSTASVASTLVKLWGHPRSRFDSYYIYMYKYIYIL